MRREFVTVGPEETLEEARQIMRLARLRHLLVARDEILLGILTYRDLLESLFEPPHDGPRSTADRVEAAMIPFPHSVTPEKPLAYAAARLWQLRVGCLPVVEETPEGRRLVGLVTETDLLRAAYDPLHRPSRRS
jgi:CBS domain-containing protein